jgi:hypothetical protein
MEEMIMYMSEKKHRIGFDELGGSMITRVRNRSISRFIRDGSFDWFLSIDSDMVFDKELLEVLLSHKKEVIGAVYRAKSNKIESTCASAQNPDVDWREKSVVMNKGVQEMRYLSGGCMLINMSVIMEMVEKFPDLKYYDDFNDEECWGFYNPLIIKHNGMNRLLSEDWSICERIYQMGIPFFADTDLRVGHLHMTALTFPKAKE